MERAKRRFYAERWKRRVHKRLQCWAWNITPRNIGITAKSRKQCSSRCCGSLRKYEGISVTEKRQFDDFYDQLEDYEI